MSVTTLTRLLFTSQQLKQILDLSCLSYDYSYNNDSIIGLVIKLENKYVDLKVPVLTCQFSDKNAILLNMFDFRDNIRHYMQELVSAMYMLAGHANSYATDASYELYKAVTEDIMRMISGSNEPAKPVMRVLIDDVTSIDDNLQKAIDIVQKCIDETVSLCKQLLAEAEIKDKIALVENL